MRTYIVEQIMIHDVARDVVRHGREARRRSGQKIKMLTTLSLSPLSLHPSFSLSLFLYSDSYLRFIAWQRAIASVS